MFLNICAAKPLQCTEHDDNTLIKTHLCPHIRNHALILHGYLSHSALCFEHSWPLCFTYLSLSQRLLSSALSYWRAKLALSSVCGPFSLLSFNSVSPPSQKKKKNSGWQISPLWIMLEGGVMYFICMYIILLYLFDCSKVSWVSSLFSVTHFHNSFDWQCVFEGLSNKIVESKAWEKNRKGETSEPACIHPSTVLAPTCL